MVRGIGQRLYEFREIYSLSQMEVGLRVGISHHLVSKYETNYHQPPFDILIKLAKLFHVTSDYISCLNSKESLFAEIIERLSELLFESKYRNIQIKLIY